MWVKNRVVVPNQQLCLCASNTCQTNGTEKTKKSTWLANEIENDDICASCKYCDGNHELRLFCNMFRV
jgi:hypothetical protein